MKYKVRHSTKYEYSQVVSISHHLLHMAPRSAERQKCLRSFIQIDPMPSVRSEALDYFRNKVSYITIQEPHEKLEISALSEIEVIAPAPLQLSMSPPWEEVAALFDSRVEANLLDVYQFAFASPYVTQIENARDLAEASFTPRRPLLEAVMDLTTRIYTTFKYEGGRDRCLDAGGGCH